MHQNTLKMEKNFRVLRPQPLVSGDAPGMDPDVGCTPDPTVRRTSAWHTTHASLAKVVPQLGGASHCLAGTFEHIVFRSQALFSLIQA